mgnify:CR=1 FL=1
MSLILIDPGHGGADSGACASGLKEKDLNLEIALKLWRLLWQKNITATLTRITDLDKSLAQRCEMANRLNASYFLSIHCNSAPDPKAEGIEVFYFPQSEQGRRWAETIFSALEKLGRVQRGIKPARFYVLKHTRMPACLVECGLISNPLEAKWLKNSTAQIAKALAEGIENHLSQNQKSLSALRELA